MAARKEGCAAEQRIWRQLLVLLQLCLSPRPPVGAKTARLEKLQQHFFQLLTEHFPDVTINGNQKHRLPNNVHVTFSGIDNERLLIELDRSGVLAAAGSACSASSSSPSHVLRAIGLSDEQAR